MDDQEEKEGNGLIANVVQMIILFWSLGVIHDHTLTQTLQGKLIQLSAAGRLAVTAQYGLNIKKGNDKKKLNDNVKIVNNKDTKVGNQ